MILGRTTAAAPDPLPRIATACFSMHLVPLFSPRCLVWRQVSRASIGYIVNHFFNSRFSASRSPVIDDLLRLPFQDLPSPLVICDVRCLSLSSVSGLEREYHLPSGIYFSLAGYKGLVYRGNLLSREA